MKYLGNHLTEEAAAHAIENYVKNGVVPETRSHSSQFPGVSWLKARGKWRASCRFTRLGYHDTEEAAAQAYIKYVEDGVGPVQFRERTSSRHKGVCWDKTRGNNPRKWKACYKKKHLGHHATEAGAYTRPLFSSTGAVSYTQYTLNTLQYTLTPLEHPLNNL